MSSFFQSPFEYYEKAEDLLIGDYTDLGKKILENAFFNYTEMSRAKKGVGLFGKFEKIPAIICGAGPSLEKHVSLLKDVGDKALVFAGGSSLNVLSHFSLPFHFGASFDPNPPYNRFYEQNGFEIPFFYQPRVSKELLKLVHGPRLWIPDNGSYPLEAFLYGEEENTFDSGWTVANFMTALAFFMGCEPIIFVGMDFAESSEKLYAAGVEEDKIKEGRIPVRDQNQALLYTKKDWLLAIHWMEDFILNHPRTYINATEGGLGFKEGEQLSLEKTIKKYLAKSFDVQAKVHAEVSALPSFPSSDFSRLEVIQKSRRNALELCEKILEVAAAHYPHPFSDKSEFILADFALEEERITQSFLNPLWNIWKKQLENEYLHKIVFFMKALKDIEHG